MSSLLLVDDEPASLLALHAVLEPLGHELVQARSGRDALRLLLDRRFAVVLLDVRMPDWTASRPLPSFASASARTASPSCS